MIGRDGRSSRARRYGALGAVLACLAGCSSDYYRKDADEEVYAIVREKQAGTLGAAPEFSLDEFGGIPEATGKALLLDLRECQRLAVKHSRSFQNERESLYLSALSLTGDRHAYAPQLFARIAGSLRGNKDASSGTVDGSGGIQKAWLWGLSSTVSIANTLMRSFTSNPQEVAASAISVAITQPLLRGFGPDIAGERLTQSERNVVYAVRSFEDARRSLAVDITQAYLRTLQLYDEVKNARANLESTRTNCDRIAAQAEWGRVPLFQLDQAKTSVLSAEESVNRSQTSLKDGLDSLKLTLGLPLEQEIELDTAELALLTAMDVSELGVDSDEAVQIGLNCRLDLMNRRDSVADAERTLAIAEDQLRAQLDVSGRISIPTPDQSEAQRPGYFKAERFTYDAGIDLELPLDRKNERNTYRRALIELDRTRRSLVDTEERIRREVATAYRTVDRAYRSYQIELASRDVARTRVESTQELIKWGRVETRDLLDALAAELRANNAVTAALIEFRVAYLEFLHAIGILHVDDEGVYIDLAQEERNAKSEG